MLSEMSYMHEAIGGGIGIGGGEMPQRSKWNVPRYMHFPPEHISTKTECSKLNKGRNPNAQMFQISLLRHILNGC